MAKPRTFDLVDAPPVGSPQDPTPPAVVAPPAPEPPAPTVISTKAKPGDVSVIVVDDGVPNLPLRPARASGRKKFDIYLTLPRGEKMEEIADWAVYNLRMRKGEAQEIILRVGLDNEIDIFRELREAATR